MSDALRAAAREAGVVLLYHAAFETLPAALSAGLHNVTPAVLHRHLSAIGRCFRFVSVDEFCAARDPRGLAAVTFDDGYKSVLHAALPVFEDLTVPFALFVNSATFEHQVFWRDKVRYVMHRNWQDAFLAGARGVHQVAGLSLYRYTKHPANDSAVVERELNRFLAARGVVLTALDYCFDNTSYFIRHPLVSYGNHSHSHYVLASLDSARQYAEIRRTETLLDRQPGIARTRVFSLPFGARCDYNDATLEAVQACGYDTMLMSRGAVHRRTACERGVQLVERFMPRGADIAGDMDKAMRRGGDD